MAIEKPLEPFQDSDRDLLDNAKSLVSDLVSKFDRAEACGQNCKAFRKTREELASQLLKIEQEFFMGDRSRGDRI